MRKKFVTKRRIAFVLMAVMLIVQIPAAAFAAESHLPVQGVETNASAEIVECNCAQKCTAEALDPHCAVCAAENADLKLCKGKAEEVAPKAEEVAPKAEEVAPKAEEVAPTPKPEKANCNCVKQCTAEKKESGTQAVIAPNCPVCLAKDADLSLCAGAGANGATGGFAVTGGSLGTDYTFSDGYLTIISGTAITVSSHGNRTDDRIIIKSGITANLTISNLNIYTEVDSNIAVQSDATLNLTIENTSSLGIIQLNHRNPALMVDEHAKLNIDGTGTLSIDSTGEDCAGIGSGPRKTAGLITINSGTIHANGSEEAAGIGSGSYGASREITINGGKVNATGGNFGAGIGGSWKSTHTRKITINDGTVIAQGGVGAVGIGSGGHSNGRVEIAISGENTVVEATGGDYAAGIGSVYNGSTGSVTITDATVTATGGYEGAGIGGASESSGGVININNATVTATGGYEGAGIGGGYKGAGGTISINNSTVTAKGNYGAGIGGGYKGAGGTITLASSKIDATGGIECAGIGSNRWWTLRWWR